MNTSPTVRNIEWVGGAREGFLRLLDQTLLPRRVEHIDCRSVQDVWDAIRRLAVRGAPAIGVAAAYGCVLGAQAGNVAAAAAHLATSRPTAVNLFWALRRMQRVQPATRENLLAEARRIHEEDAAMCQAIGRHGLQLIEPLLALPGGKVSRTMPGAMPGAIPGVLTHCNAGTLATGGIGTATAPLYLAKQKGLRFGVLADETRPLLQGARLTAFELAQAGIDVTLICDNMAGSAMAAGMVRLVIVGADRIAANGDVANKIGTYPLAVVARHHQVPFFVAAPSSTFDLSIPDGSHIPIEQRPGSEITRGPGAATAPDGIQTFNPAFDVTPAALISAIITERGLIQPVDAVHVRATLGG